MNYGPRYVLIRRFEELTGYSEKAVRRKIEDGVWLQGDVWVKAPDGHILIDLWGYDRWAAESGAPLSYDTTRSRKPK